MEAASVPSGKVNRWLLVSVVVLVVGLGGLVTAYVGKEATTKSAASTASPEAGPTDVGPVASLVMDPSDSSILYAGTQKGLFKSSDGARSWNRLPTGSEVIGVYVDPAWPSTIYAIDSKGLQRSDDGGATWVDLSDASGAPRIYAYMAGVWFRTTSTPSTVYMWGLRDETLNVWRSTDRGETWTRLSAAAQVKAAALQNTPRAKSVAVQQALDLFLASSGGSFGGFVTDKDTGARVESIRTGPDVVIIDPDRASNFYVATKLGVYKSVDGGMTWRKASAGL
jgi:hypothetical protein